MIATVDHAHHRLRRSPIASFFSKTNVRKLDYILHSHVSKLRLRLKEYEASGEPFNIINAYKSLAGDVVTTYAFGQNNNYLDTPGFNAPFWKMFHDLSFGGTANDHFPWILPIVMSLPDWYVSRDHFSSNSEMSQEEFFFIHHPILNRFLLRQLLSRHISGVMTPIASKKKCLLTSHL
jgi:hypothetical protein